jgi:hypothetical protein
MIVERVAKLAAKLEGRVCDIMYLLVRCYYAQICPVILKAETTAH